MTILILFALAFRITGDVAHEWIGLVVFVLFVVHNVINIHWYKQLFRKRKEYSSKWVLNTVTNILLVVLMSVMAITGFMQSKIILSVLELPGSMSLRQVHTMTSYWGYVLVSIHLGMHWQMLFKLFFGKAVNGANGRFYKILLPITGVAIAACGIWAFIERDMYSKLFLGLSFDFWDKPTVLFFVYHFLIMALWVWVTYYILKFISLFKRNQIKNRSIGKEKNLTVKVAFIATTIENTYLNQNENPGNNQIINNKKGKT
ncbi:MAG: DUF4405 domain-containing protein [Emcibacter sp.]|nr:DUF4405 domain-containing protein [Emcibacter sp.]